MATVVYEVDVGESDVEGAGEVFVDVMGSEVRVVFEEVVEGLEIKVSEELFMFMWGNKVVDDVETLGESAEIVNMVSGKEMVVESDIEEVEVVVIKKTELATLNEEEVIVSDFEVFDGLVVVESDSEFENKLVVVNSEVIA